MLQYCSSFIILINVIDLLGIFIFDVYYYMTVLPGKSPVAKTKFGK